SAVGPPYQVGRIDRRRLYSFHWRHSELDHYCKFARIKAMWIYGGIGAKGYLYAGIEGAADVLTGRPHHDAGFSHHEFGNANPLVVLHEPTSQVQGGDEILALLLHHLNGLLVNE